MIPELGHVALWLALALSLALTLLAALGAAKGDHLLTAFAPRLAAAQLLFVAIAFALLVYAFVSDDFSVLYVANNSNSELPLQYKLSAVWGAHEGSALLWLLMICLWTQLAATFSNSLQPATRARILAILGALCFGFALFSVATSNPFVRVLPFPPLEGADLNPQLQDIGLILHPPMLYIGYIGFAVIFAAAIAALWEGEFSADLVKWSRPWAAVPWAFLGLGIVLGSWWAYYELGWGGWWFWDAVENASFMPWLAGTALLHSLAVTEKRGMFHGWTLLLAILTFSLSMLGAFIVRSGVLTSVHAFAQDPQRGLFILAFLVLISGGALLLFALRVRQSTASPQPLALFSRETFILINNLLLLVATATVLLGTLFPLAYEALSGGAKLSVGPPYFNQVFLPLMALLMVVIAIGPFSHWGGFKDWRSRLRPLYWAAPLSLIAGAALTLWLSLGFKVAFSLSAMLAASLSIWVVVVSCIHIYTSIKLSTATTTATAAAFIAVKRSAGMWLAHIGLAVTAFGAVATTVFSEEQSLYLQTGQQTTLGGYQFRFQGVRNIDGPNYDSVQGILEVSSGDDSFVMRPEKRFYRARQMVMTEAAIKPGFWRDLYVALGEKINEGSAYSMRIQYKPFVRWIWLGGLMMALGAVLAVLARSRDKVTPPRTGQAQ